MIKGERMNNLKKLREKHGYTQKKVANAFCMTATQYGRRERCEVPLTEEEVKRTAKFYNCDIGKILGD